MKFVDVEALNFRSEPEVAPDNRIGVLHLCQPVSILDPDAAPGWVRISASVDGADREGFVSELHLRDPVSDGREVLLAATIAEWLRFEQGLGKEFQTPYSDFVGEMWQAIGMDLDGNDRDVPWSAACISFMVRNAAQTEPVYGSFKFAAAHARYVHDSIKRRFEGDETSPFWGFRLHERRPQLGDMVCRWRISPTTFDDAAERDRFSSHCDIVVRVKNDSVLTLGGNVGHTVKITEYDKTPAGFLDDTKNVFAHLVNRL
ncbi:MAG: DUF2272 domain-containing protein [Rhodobacteraceae bacterium]|nr:DUF2272 domain-containing protein [Paracoccaceae bacterium]